MKKNFVVAIDGPVGSGKSAVARGLAKKIGFGYLDTGAMYRAVTLKALREKVDMTDPDALTAVARAAKIELIREDSTLRVILDGEDVTREIRSLEVTNNSYRPSQTAGVRARMVEIQREVSRNGRLVAEGRDMGTVVFPDSPAKFYIDASVDERTRRRLKEEIERGNKITFEELREQVIIRDKRDSERELSPLRKADDAIYVDSTGMTLEQVIGHLADILGKRGLI